MFADTQTVLDLMVFVVVRGFALAMVIGFISWGFWYVVEMFKGITRV